MEGYLILIIQRKKDELKILKNRRRPKSQAPAPAGLSRETWNLASVSNGSEATG